jgi:hypothetical protein
MTTEGLRGEIVRWRGRGGGGGGRGWDGQNVPCPGLRPGAGTTRRRISRRELTVKIGKSYRRGSQHSWFSNVHA